ncbi:uncharacterized protein LOC127810823 isoform X2 [Diospyros lotus]|nr:uncharacterized protein LOC127810823 isoform X2 [Diospyros lotus]
MLDHEQKVQETLQRLNHQDQTRSLPIPHFLPPKVKELLAELDMVEGEIARLEAQIRQLQTDLSHEKEVTKDYKLKQYLHHATIKNPAGYSPLPSYNSHSATKAAAATATATGRMQFETKALHFISKAIKGDYNLNDFNVNIEKPRVISDHKESNNFRDDELAFQDQKVPKKSGILKPASPLREPSRNPTPIPRRERNVEFAIDFPPKSATNTAPSEEESIQKWPPNKLAENIMKCLIFIFVRLLRTSRAMELEKSGPISRSTNFSLSFRVDMASSNSKAALLQKEARQQDPYGIFDTEESIPRDIGPYKNLVMFTSSHLDPKCISNSSSVPLLQRLRILMNSLQKVDLRSLSYQQKLAFWINMYNACIMHGFLQYGVPSSPEKLLALINKATLSIGGNTINAHAIEHFILRKPESSILKEVYRKADKEDKEAMVRQLYGLESLDPNITFALCCGTRSSPAVRIYTAEGVVAELEKSKLEYLQASIMVMVTTSTKRIALPELLLRNMHDFAPNIDSLLEWLCHQLPTSGSLRKSMVDCFRGLANGKDVSAIVEKIPYDFEFQYLLSI